MHAGWVTASLGVAEQPNHRTILSPCATGDRAQRPGRPAGPGGSGGAQCRNAPSRSVRTYGQDRLVLRSASSEVMGSRKRDAEWPSF